MRTALSTIETSKIGKIHAVADDDNAALTQLFQSLDSGHVSAIPVFIESKGLFIFMVGAYDLESFSGPRKASYSSLAAAIERGGNPCLFLVLRRQPGRVTNFSQAEILAWRWEGKWRSMTNVWHRSALDVCQYYISMRTKSMAKLFEKMKQRDAVKQILPEKP